MFFLKFFCISIHVENAIRYNSVSYYYKMIHYSFAVAWNKGS